MADGQDSLAHTNGFIQSHSLFLQFLQKLLKKSRWKKCEVWKKCKKTHKRGIFPKVCLNIGARQGNYKKLKLD